MAIRVDTSSWIPGAILVGDTGFGVLGSEVPSTGDNGAGYLYNDLTLPDDASKEVCGRITTWPSAGTLYAYEDSSFTFTGAPDGSYSFEYQLYVDGVATDDPVPVTLNVGEGIISIPAGSLTLTGYAPTVVTAAGNLIEVPAGTLTLTGYAPIPYLAYPDPSNVRSGVIYGPSGQYVGTMLQATLKRWDGGQWVDAGMKYWNGSSWV